jgi:hypothetical protein
MPPTTYQVSMRRDVLETCQLAVWLSHVTVLLLFMISNSLCAMLGVHWLCWRDNQTSKLLTCVLCQDIYQLNWIMHKSPPLLLPVPIDFLQSCKRTEWTDLKSNCLISVDSAFGSIELVVAGPHLCRSVVSMGMERTIDWRKSEKGRDETTAKWLWHARPSLLSRGRAFRVGCWCKSLCKTFYTKKRIDRSPRRREKRTKSIPLPLPLWAPCGWQGRSRLGTICKFRRSARQ